MGCSFVFKDPFGLGFAEVHLRLIVRKVRSLLGS